MASTGPPQSLKRSDSSLTREGDQLIITPLGTGNEVGRSCVYMFYKGKTILFDCGIHPAYSGMAALPYFDEIDPSTIDVLLVTHFHLDHAASLPYFLKKTTFKGRVFMTHATKAIYKLLLTDYVKVSKVSVEEMLYDEQDILHSMDKIEVHYISFSAHAYFSQTSTFLKELMPPNIILVHGEANEMGRHKRKLITQFADRNTKIISPKNCQSVEMYFNSEKMAKTIGRLAEKTPEVGETVSGLLVKKGFTYQIMAPDDLHVFSQLSTANVTQRITIPYTGAFGVIKHRLKQIYESVESLPDEESEVPAFRVHERVTVKHESEKHISLHWTSDPISDMVSDSIVALVLNISREIPKVVVELEALKTEEENGKKAEKVIHALLVSLFGDVKFGEDGKLVISVDGNVAHLDKQSGNVDSENEDLKERVRVAFQQIQNAVKPIPLSVS